MCGLIECKFLLELLKYLKFPETMRMPSVQQVCLYTNFILTAYKHISRKHDAAQMKRKTENPPFNSHNNIN